MPAARNQDFTFTYIFKWGRGKSHQNVSFFSLLDKLRASNFISRNWDRLTLVIRWVFHHPCYTVRDTIQYKAFRHVLATPICQWRETNVSKIIAMNPPVNRAICFSRLKMTTLELYALIHYGTLLRWENVPGHSILRNHLTVNAISTNMTSRSAIREKNGNSILIPLTRIIA